MRDCHTRQCAHHRLATATYLFCLLLPPAASPHARDESPEFYTADDFLPNWMGHMSEIISDSTLLDLALPGSHDTMTYDLSDALSDGYEGMPSVVSKILHALTPLVAGQFIRDQGRTQGINVTAQLEGGLRFLDFRTLYSEGGNHKYDWYCLHGCQTNHPSLSYLKQIRSWLDSHPKEMAVLWLSRHGDESLNGTKQYPGTTVTQRQAYWHQIEQVFEGKLVDSKNGLLNEVTMAEHWSLGEQVVIYATDYQEFTGGSSKAIDAMHIVNQLGGSSITNIPKGVQDAVGCFSAETRSSDKAKNNFYLVSMANSGPQFYEAAAIKYVPLAKRAAEKACAKIFHIPNMSWCPLTLMDVGLLGNYYNQQVLEEIYQAMRNGTTSREFPNAIYIDAVDSAGTIRTGPAQICGMGADCTTTLPMPPPSTSHGSQAYAYAATVIGSNLFRLCPRAARPRAAACRSLGMVVEGLRGQHPLTLWDDPEHGRLSSLPRSWPTAQQVQPIAHTDIV